MLAIGVEFLQGTVRAGSADDLAATGETDPGEWPPSPARLFAAFVAADGTRGRCRVTTGTELGFLEGTGDPVILADRAESVRRTELLHRFVVVDEKAKGAVQEYPARAAAEVRPGTRLSPSIPVVWFTWPDASPDVATLAGLRARAARIGYLGCADSPVRVRVSDTAPQEDGLATWLPVIEGRGEVALPVAFPGMLGLLDDAYERFAGGEPVRRSWLPTLRRWYSPDRPAEDVANPTVVWLRLGDPVPGRLARMVTETLRAATLDLYDRFVAPSPGDLPAVLHGHGYSGSGYQHVHWLVLPDVGHPYATGRLHGAAVWLPADTPRDTVERVRAALAHLHELVLPGRRRVPVVAFDGSPRPMAANPARWVGPARRWASVLPVVHERWGPVTLGQVAAWCEHAGLPAPLRSETAEVPFVEGGIGLQPTEVYRDGRERRPYSHLLIEFAEPVRGPVMVGRVRQFGLGLLCPLDHDRGARGGRDDG
jgi:CRISPR-associated protein Csb2